MFRPAGYHVGRDVAMNGFSPATIDREVEGYGKREDAHAIQRSLDRVTVSYESHNFATRRHRQVSSFSP